MSSTCSTAVQDRFAEAWATLDELLPARSVFIHAFFFVALLYGTVRMFGVRPWASAAGVAFVHRVIQLRRSVRDVLLLW